MSSYRRTAIVLVGVALLAGGLACQGPMAAPGQAATRQERDITARPGWVESPSRS